MAVEMEKSEASEVVMTPLTELSASQIRMMQEAKHPLAELALELGLRRVGRTRTLTPAESINQALAIARMRKNGHAR